MKLNRRTPHIPLSAPIEFHLLSLGLARSRDGRAENFHTFKFMSQLLTERAITNEQARTEVRPTKVIRLALLASRRWRRIANLLMNAHGGRGRWIEKFEHKLGTHLLLCHRLVQRHAADRPDDIRAVFDRGGRRHGEAGNSRFPRLRRRLASPSSCAPADRPGNWGRRTCRREHQG